jgi:hypothetical protein
MAKLRAALLGAWIAAAASGARAERMQLGVQDFSDGQILGCFSPRAGCAVGWTGATDPFNRFVGSDPELGSALNFSTRWTFDVSRTGATLPGAVRLEIGLYDHDSAASGSQLDSFWLDPGTAAAQDLSPLLDAALEAPGVGEQQEYDVLAIDLPPAARASLFSSSSATFALALKGPALIQAKSGGVVEAAGSNGAGLDFARLTLTYGAAPEPASALLCALAGAWLAGARIGRRLCG